MDLACLLKPRSVAIVGASDRPSLGRTIQVSLDRLGFQGGVFPINPKYPEVLGRPCSASIRELPDAPDVAAICLAADRCLDAVRDLAGRGARAAVIYDAGFKEAGGANADAESEIAAICREAGIALLGPNCMGALSPHARASTYINEVRRPEALAGNVGFVSQSGAVCVSLLADLRRFQVSHVVSSGNEAVVRTSDLIDFLVDDPDTRIIACFTEAVRDPERYVAALDRAADAGKPVVVLKVGRSDRTRRAIATHTGGLAGETRVFSEVLRRHRAIEVGDFDEMVEVLAAFQAPRRPKGRRLAVLTGSGGQAELVLDVAGANCLDLPPLSTELRAEIEAGVGPLTGDGNPADIWGKGTWLQNIAHTVEAIGQRDEIDAVAVCFDFHDAPVMGAEDRYVGYADTLTDLATRTPLPLFHMNTRPGLLHDDLTRRLREAGIASVCGSRQGLGAIDALARFDASRPVPRAPVAADTSLAALARPGSPPVLDEVRTKALLRGWNVPVVDEVLAGSLDEARAAAHRLGYPVVLKAVSADIPHKSDLGLVALGLSDEAALIDAWTTLVRCAGAAAREARLEGCVVQPFVTGGVEVFAGVTRDPDFGPVLAVGLGGVLVEALRDFALRPVPLLTGEAEAMVRELRGAAILDGLRGAPPSDVEALCACLYAVADFAAREADVLQDLDLNPIKVLPRGQGCVVLDALAVLRT